jgi:sugar phosphate isomerase/epimerase
MNKLKLACADFTFPLLPHDKVLDLIAMLDFEGADLGLFEGRSHLWPSKEYKNPTKCGKAIGRKLADRGLKAADIFLQMNPDFTPYAINHPQSARRKKARDWFARTLDYAEAAGAKHVSCLPGVLFDSEPNQTSWSRTVDEMNWRVAQAKAQGITLGTEAHVGSLAPDPKSAKKLVEDVPGLTLTLDYTHFTRVGLPDSAVEPLVKHASHFHARGARKGRLQAPVKENSIDYRRVLKAMKQTGYQGYVGVEYVWIDWEHCNECDNLSETILLRDLIRDAHRA